MAESRQCVLHQRGQRMPPQTTESHTKKQSDRPTFGRVTLLLLYKNIKLSKDFLNQVIYSNKNQVTPFFLKGYTYICNVFFIVLDLRLTRSGYRGIPFFLPFCQPQKHPPRKTLTSTKQTIYLWRNSHTPPPNHPKEERERNTRCANMQRRPEAKHCSSLCLQSEGDEDCGGQARAKNPTKSCPDALTMFATCSWPSLCEQSELQCWRRNRRLYEPAQFFAARALPPNLIVSGF